MADSPTTRKNVLLVDDERAFVEMLGELMQTQPGEMWNVQLATSTAQALATLRDAEISALSGERANSDGPDGPGQRRAQFCSTLER
mgnify:CR=1 FL=1